MTNTSESHVGKYLSPLVSCSSCREIKSISGMFSQFIISKENTTTSNKYDRKYQKQKAIDIRINYNLNPNFCICGAPKSYKTRNGKYCSQSCAAITNNLKRDPNIAIKQGIRLGEKFASMCLYPKPPKELCIDKNTKARYTKISWCCICNKCFPGERKTCSKECYTKKLSETAKLNPALGGNKNNKAYGWYESKFAGKVWLESSYEYKVAVDLDVNNINWIRPKSLNYGSKKYYADFYLTEQNIYLDPKNDYLIPLDTPKIQQVMLENSVIIHILNKHQLSWDYIQTLLNI